MLSLLSYFSEWSVHPTGLTSGCRSARFTCPGGHSSTDHYTGSTRTNTGTHKNRDRLNCC